MPSSRPNHIPVVLSIIRQMRPLSILDLGTGFGKWGMLFREYTDIVKSEKDSPRYKRENWKVRIDGIEGHSDYITPVHKYVYNNLYEGQIQDILPNLEKYDIIFLGDVIEHFPKEEGVALMKECIRHSNYAVVVSTPATFVEQGPACDNKLEIHRSHWTRKDFEKIGGNSQIIDGDILVGCITTPGIQVPAILHERRNLANRISRLLGIVK